MPQGAERTNQSNTPQSNQAQRNGTTGMVKDPVRSGFRCA